MHDILPILTTSERSLAKKCACGEKHYARGMCRRCYLNWYRANPEFVRIKPGSPQRGMITSVTKGANHQRVRNARGKASMLRCFNCKGKAKDWAQIHGTDGTDPYEHYRPLCRSCHLHYDGRPHIPSSPSLAVTMESDR